MIHQQIHFYSVYDVTPLFSISVSVGRCIQKFRLKKHSFAIRCQYCLPDSKQMRVFGYNEY